MMKVQYQGEKATESLEVETFRPLWWITLQNRHPVLKLS